LSAVALLLGAIACTDEPVGSGGLPGDHPISTDAGSTDAESDAGVEAQAEAASDTSVLDSGTQEDATPE
jgi:hypothetical protein